MGHLGGEWQISKKNKISNILKLTTSQLSFDASYSKNLFIKKKIQSTVNKCYYTNSKEVIKTIIFTIKGILLVE